MMMSRYNQQYSEIQKMPYKDIVFYTSLIEAEDTLQKEMMEKQNREIKKMRLKR